MTHGITIWLCRAHRSTSFLTRRAGREFSERLAAIWTASGVLTVRRQAALDAHVQRIRSAGVAREKPGSYSWPQLRREAERRFAAGEKPADVIAELRGNYRDGPAMVPSVRTMRRWFTQARWLTAPVADRHRRARPRTRRSTDRAHPLVELILTGYGYPRPHPIRRIRPP